MKPFALRDGELFAEDVAHSPTRRRVTRTPSAIAYSARRYVAGGRSYRRIRLRRGLRGRAAPRVLRAEGEFQPRDPRSAGARGQRLRHRLRRRARAGHRGRRRSRQGGFSGVGKTESEMQQALAADILCFNVESASELERLNSVAGALADAGRRSAFASTPTSIRKRIRTSRPDSRKASSAWHSRRRRRSSRTRRRCPISPSTASTATSDRKSPTCPRTWRRPQK